MLSSLRKRSTAAPFTAAVRCFAVASKGPTGFSPRPPPTIDPHRKKPHLQDLTIEPAYVAPEYEGKNPIILNFLSTPVHLRRSSGVPNFGNAKGFPYWNKKHERMFHNYFLIDDVFWMKDKDFENKMRYMLWTGSTCVQLFLQDVSKEEYCKHAQRIIDFMKDQRYHGYVPLVIGDNIDVCNEVGADGVHVHWKIGEEKAVKSLELAKSMRDKLGKDKIVGIDSRVVDCPSIASAGGGAKAVTSTSKAVAAKNSKLATNSYHEVAKQSEMQKQEMDGTGMIYQAAGMPSYRKIEMSAQLRTLLNKSGADYGMSPGDMYAWGPHQWSMS